MPETPRDLTWTDVNKGDIVPRVSLDITVRRLIVNAGAGWEVFPGHYDRDYARAHGHEDIFANTSLFLSFADRVVTDWAGPRTRIARRAPPDERSAPSRRHVARRGHRDGPPPGRRRIPR